MWPWSQKRDQNIYKKLNFCFPSDHLTRWSFELYFKLTLSWRGPKSYRNQSIDLQSKSMDWFLYDIGLRHERVKASKTIIKEFLCYKIVTIRIAYAFTIPKSQISVITGGFALQSSCFQTYINLLKVNNRMFKVNYKDTRKMSMTLFWCLYW